jgi:hypothetical protein
MTKVVERRVGDVREELDEIIKHVAKLPALPDSPRGAVLDELVLVLAALMRENLPEYADVNLDVPAIGRTPEPATPEDQEAVWAAEAAEARRRVAEELAKREAAQNE